jgi:hypothetical protein
MSGYVYGGTDFDTTRPAHWAKPGPKPRTELPPFNPALCGTGAGYQQHARHGQERCEKCKTAHNENQTEYRAGYRARRRGGG